MRALLRGALSFAWDRSWRAALLAAAGTALLLPRALLFGDSGPAAAGFRAGLEAGPGPGSALLAGLWGIFLLAGVLVLWQGVVSSHVESGRFRVVLVRPVWRPGVYLARHLAAVSLLAAAACGVAGLLRIVGAGAIPDPAGLLMASLLTGWTLGALLLLLSSLMDRGDALAGVALFLAPGALDGLRGDGGPATEAAGRLLAAVLPPTLPLADVRRALLSGAEPEGSVVATLALYGAAALGLALLRLQLREYRPG